MSVRKLPGGSVGVEVGDAHEVGEVVEVRHLGQVRERPGDDREAEVRARIDRVRGKRARLREDRITMAHGAGGKATATLVEAVFLEALGNPLLARLEDQATFPVGGAHLAFTTDSYVVSPLFFKGGSIGDLAVNGTVNDLAVGGARPLHLSAAFILEEGFEVEALRRIVADMAAAAERAGVHIITGDTKVVQRGKGDGCFINTAGIGVVAPGHCLDARSVRRGDVALVSGTIGEHGATILLARGDLDIESDVASDTAPLHGLVQQLLEAAPQTRCMRDATRGGVATVLNEIAAASGVSIRVEESAIPLRDDVRGICELLGIDPLYVACEGRLVAFVPPDQADAALAAMQAHPLGTRAAKVGVVVEDSPGLVVLRTQFGGSRVVDMLVGDPLPRIC